jgi:hypothetical protein
VSAEELRSNCAQELMQHPQRYTLMDAPFLVINDKEYGTMLTDQAHDVLLHTNDRKSAVKKEAELTFNDKQWAGLLQVMALTNVLKRPIYSVYPDNTQVLL